MAIPLRKNMIVSADGRFLRVLDFKEVKTGQQKPKIHCTFKDVKSGAVIERTLDSLGTYEEVACTMRNMKYLYCSDKEYFFMDNATFDQVALTRDFIGSDIPFLLADQDYRMMMLDETPLGLELPPVVVLKVEDTPPPSHAGASNVLKEARLETGLVIRVPLFIKNGDRIRVDRASRQYGGKEND